MVCSTCCKYYNHLLLCAGLQIEGTPSRLASQRCPSISAHCLDVSQMLSEATQLSSHISLSRDQWAHKLPKVTEPRRMRNLKQRQRQGRRQSIHKLSILWQRQGRRHLMSPLSHISPHLKPLEGAIASSSLHALHRNPILQVWQCILISLTNPMPGGSLMNVHMLSTATIGEDRRKNQHLRSHFDSQDIFAQVSFATYDHVPDMQMSGQSLLDALCLG